MCPREAGEPKLLRCDDTRHAFRRLRRHIGAAAASVAALACAIGAAVATWSLLSSVLLRPLPVEAPEQLFQVDEPRPSMVTDRWVSSFSYPVLEAFRDSGTFAGVAAGGLQQMLVEEQGSVPQRRQVYFAAYDFFATLGISAAQGRTFTADEDRRGAPAVAVLSDRYWRTVFDADPGVLGRTVTVSGLPATVIGVLPRAFRGLHLSEAPDLYLPLHIAGDIDRQAFFNFDPLGAELYWLRIVGRVRPGQTPAAAAAQLNALDCLCPRGLTHGEIGPLSLTNVNSAAVPELARANTNRFATLLSVTVGLLLLIGCLTVGMLLLVRTEDRRDELAVRLALGATRGRLASDVVVEAAILCALGAVLAVPVALWLTYGIRAFRLPGAIDIERLELTLDPGSWLAVTAAAFAATSAIALLACLTDTMRSPLRPRVLAAPRVTRRAPRAALVASQVAITVVLVTGAGLFTRSLTEALSLNFAIETDRIVRADIDLGPHGYTPERAAAFMDELLARLRQNRLIESVSIMDFVGGMQAGLPVSIDGMRRELPSGLGYASADDAFFATLGLPIVSGRSFAGSDTAGTQQVAVVSESLGRFIAGGGSPIGRSFPGLRRGPAPPADLLIVGVAPDLITEVDDTEPLMVYQPLAQLPLRASAWIFLRAARDPDDAIREVMTAARALEPRLSLQNVMTLDEQIVAQMQPQRFGLRVLGALGGIALLLTVLGTYVLAESMVAGRRRELGIRAALGAGSARLRGLVLRDTARLVGVGLAAGLVLAAVGARAVRSLLYRVEPLDPGVLAGVSALILGLSLLVSLRPALAAARLDLTRSLREE